VTIGSSCLDDACLSNCGAPALYKFGFGNSLLSTNSTCVFLFLFIVVGSTARSSRPCPLLLETSPNFPSSSPPRPSDEAYLVACFPPFVGGISYTYIDVRSESERERERCMCSLWCASMASIKKHTVNAVSPERARPNRKDQQHIPLTTCRLHIFQSQAS
jgi:hypothetical protein